VRGRFQLLTLAPHLRLATDSTEHALNGRRLGPSVLSSTSTSGDASFVGATACSGTLALLRGARPIAA